jgi:pimeloyl-ACP methyl ester carboxylesterase
MTVSPRLLGKSIFLFCLLVLLVLGFFFAWFASWRSDRIAALEFGSEIAKTDRGPVEFLVRGEGPAVLVFHSAPGGYDQAMLMGSTFAGDGFQIIAPSRPGYLRTPLATGLTPEQQADATADLIGKMGLSSVAVLASSWGAPAAIQFVIRHPEKVWALVLISPLTARFDSGARSQASEPGRLLLDGLKGDVGAWLFVESAERDPQGALSWVVDAVSNGTAAQGESLPTYALSDSDQIEWFKSLVGTFAPLSVRQAGLLNDLVQGRALSDFPFEQITAPTLVVHGTADRWLPFAAAEVAARRIPGAILFPVEGAGHLVEIGPQASNVQGKVVEFLGKHSEGQPGP